MSKKLTDVETLALAKAIKKGALGKARPNVKSGTHEVDVLVRVHGSVTVGDDFEQIQHMKVPQWELIAVLLSKVNGATLESVVREALGFADKAELKRIKADAQVAVDKIKGTGKSPTKGKVTAKLEAERVSVPEVREETDEAVEADVAGEVA